MLLNNKFNFITKDSLSTKLMWIWWIVKFTCFINSEGNKWSEFDYQLSEWMKDAREFRSRHHSNSSHNIQAALHILLLYVFSIYISWHVFLIYIFFVVKYSAGFVLYREENTTDNTAERNDLWPSEKINILVILVESFSLQFTKILTPYSPPSGSSSSFMWSCKIC